MAREEIIYVNAGKSRFMDGDNSAFRSLPRERLFPIHYSLAFHMVFT
jgi:hypothetical protein